MAPRRTLTALLQSWSSFRVFSAGRSSTRNTILTFPTTRLYSTVVPEFPYLYRDRVIYPPGLSYNSSECDWIPPLRVSNLLRISEGKQVIGRDDTDHLIVTTNLLGVEFDSEQQLFDYYIKVLAHACGSEEEAKKKIYLVSCGQSFGFGAHFSYTEWRKLQENWNVVGVWQDGDYHSRKKDPIEQSDVHFVPKNRNQRLANIYGYHHLSERCTNWNSDHWLINIMEPDTDQIIDLCIKMLAEVVGSEEAAIEKIYIIWGNFPIGFGAEVDEETANKLRGLANVQNVLPDYAFDVKDMCHGNQGAICILPRSEDHLFSLEGNLGESGNSICSCAVRSIPHFDKIDRDNLLHNIFSYHYLSERNSAWGSDHWLIHVKQPTDGFRTKQQTVIFCIRMLAEVIGSDEVAKKKIYAVWCKEPFGFGAEMDEVTSNKLKGLPYVLTVLPDYAFDIKNKSHGALLISSFRDKSDGLRTIDYFNLCRESSKNYEDCEEDHFEDLAEDFDDSEDSEEFVPLSC